MTQGFCSFLHLGVGGGCDKIASCFTGPGPRFKCVLLCLQIRMKIKIFNSIKKQQDPKLL